LIFPSLRAAPKQDLPSQKKAVRLYARLRQFVSQ
jgi:hypothetical protein